jgi:hypothetical protein
MQGVKVKESNIAGLGLFTDQEFNEGDLIGIAHINGQPSPMIGKYHNHSDDPNAHSILLGNKRYIAALRPLRKGEEITVDYRKQPELEQPEEFAKGGSVNMPKASKKGLASKRYTKDLTGTNRLFTKNALLKKPKSKKTRVYDPNAKYYAEGGESETEVVPEMPTPNPGNAISSAPTFNAAFKIARSTYGPNHIFEYQGRKYGTNLTGEDFKPSEDVLAQAGLNTPSVKENLNKQNSDLNDPYASKSTVKLEPDSYKSWDEIKQKNLELNTSANADKIINYKNNTGGDRNYIIVDKKKGLMHVYEPGNNKALFTSPIDLGATEGDAQTVTKIKDTNGDGKIDSKEAQVGAADFDKGNKSTGAGKYYISNIDPEGYGGLPLFNMMNESQYQNFLKTGKVDNVATSIHKGFIPDDDSRVSNGCIRCNKTTLNNLTKYLENSSEVYILPEDPNNEFIIENDKLNLKVKNKSPYYTYKNNGKVYKKENGAWYIAPKMGEQFVKITQIDRIKELNKNATNASYNFYEDAKGNVQKGQGVNLGSTLNYVPIKAKLDKEKFVNDKFTYFDFSDDKELEVVNKFVSSLEQNKQKAMKAAKINGDVYNDIAQIAFGIFGTESNFADTHSAVGNLARATQKYFDPKGSSSPDYQSKYSTYGANEKSRSVGLTQIRWNYLSDDEKKALKSVGITSNADFMEPSKAALGTTVVLGIRYNQQLTDKQKKDIWTTLPKTWNTRDNYASRVLDNSKYLNLEQKVTNKNSATKKDKWGRPATSKWYGFNPKTKKYEYQNGGIIDQNEIDDANTTMMKAKLAYANMHGNAAAQRMIVAPDQPYQFDNGMTGTHYMASMDDYAVPQIQDVNGQLMLGDYGPDSMEAIRFDNPEDAQYFAENYKNVSPAFLNEKAKGGALLTKEVTCKKCGWEWDAADGGDDITTCHKCGGQGLIHAQEGAAVNGDDPSGRKKTRFQPGTYDPNETAGYMLDEKEVVVPAKASKWGKAAIAYEKRNPEEDFVDKKKKQYLKKNKGLNELYGVNMENFPQDVEENFKNEYDYNKNTAVVKKVGRQEGWNPNRRTQYVSNLNDTQRSIVADSKYGSKLQPSYWSRGLAGVQEFGNFIAKQLPGEQGDIFKYQVPGLTKKEQKEIGNSNFGALEMFSPMDIPGAAIANFVKNTGLSTGSDYKEQPGLLSGQKMENVTDLEATLLNPLTYVGLEQLPEAGVNLAKGLYKAGNAGVDLAKTNPQAWFKTPEQLLETPGLYRSVRGETTWKDPVGKLNKFVDDSKIKSSLKRENELLNQYPGWDNRKTRIPLQQEEQLKRFQIEKAAEERNLNRTKLPIKPILTEQGTHLGGGQGALYVNTLNPEEVVKLGTFPGGSEELANLVQAGKNLEGMPLMENVAFPTKAFTLKTPKVKGNTVIMPNSETVQFMPWKGNPLDVNNPVNKHIGFGIPSDKAKRELQYMAELLDENKVGIDYFGNNNIMYDAKSDSYKLVDLNYADDPKRAWDWNQLDKPVKQRIEDKFGYEIPQGELPLKLEFANSKSIKPMLGDKIGDNTGKFNLGVYNFKDYPQYIAKVEDPASVAATQGLDADQYINAMVERTKNLDPSQFAKVLKTVEGKEGKRVLVMPKLRGTLGSKLDTDLVQSIPDQSYENFYNNLKLLRDEGLNYDFLGDNFMYDPYTEQFNLFDLSPQSNRTVEPTSGNEYFFETEVFGKGNPGIYGKEQAGENLKDAMRKKLTRTYMETFPGDQEMYGLDEYSQRIEAILKGLNPQRYGGVQF